MPPRWTRLPLASAANWAQVSGPKQQNAAAVPKTMFSPRYGMAAVALLENAPLPCLSPEELRALDRRLAQQTQLLDELQARPAAAQDVREVVKEVEVIKEVEVVREVDREVIPDAALARLDALADRAEALVAKAKAG